MSIIKLCSLVQKSNAGRTVYPYLGPVRPRMKGLDGPYMSENRPTIFSAIREKLDKNSPWL